MSDAADTALPKQELLIKLLRMTTSDNDNEALMGIRKANALLTAAGWDWQKLIEGKIRIIEDPFKNLGTPMGGGASTAKANAPAQPRPSYNPATPPRPAYTPPPPRPAPKPQTWPIGINPNKFAGWCYCCGTEVVAMAGVIFKPNQYSVGATSDWKISCLPCNSTATVQSYPAQRRPKPNNKGRGSKPFVSDLS